MSFWERTHQSKLFPAITRPNIWRKVNNQGCLTSVHARSRIFIAVTAKNTSDIMSLSLALDVSAITMVITTSFARQGQKKQNWPGIEFLPYSKKRKLQRLKNSCRKNWAAQFVWKSWVFRQSSSVDILSARAVLKDMLIWRPTVPWISNLWAEKDLSFRID